MEHSNFGSVVQIATSLAVIIGLVLVVLELQQSRELARHQLVQGVLTGAQSEFMTRYGDDVVKSMAAACSTPSDLSSEDAFAMDALSSYHAYYIAKTKVLGDLGLGVHDWIDEAHIQVGFITGFPQGKSWLKGYVSRDPEIMAFLRDEATSVEPTPCENTLKTFGVDT